METQVYGKNPKDRENPQRRQEKIRQSRRSSRRLEYTVEKDDHNRRLPRLTGRSQQPTERNSMSSGKQAINCIRICHGERTT